jgi:hypothetical protein
MRGRIEKERKINGGIRRVEGTKKIVFMISHLLRPFSIFSLEKKRKKKKTLIMSGESPTTRPVKRKINRS